MYGETIDDMAREYWRAVNNKPNGWGQHCHPETGEQSHHIMIRMVCKFHIDETEAAIERAR